MPLPTDPGAWPPADLKPYIDSANRSAAWWSGDRQQLGLTSGQSTVAGQTVTEAGRRRFWRRRTSGDTTKATPQLHAPLAADIASVSSDLLFGDEVKLTSEDTKAQEQLDLLADQIGLHNTLAEGAEIAAATGGVYLRPAWDDQVADHPLLQVYDQRHAIPDFRYGRLVAVTLWEDVLQEGAAVWRHLERHEHGRILHGLYKGTWAELGQTGNLEEHPATQGTLPEVVLSGRLADRLLPSYVPNVLPNRRGSKPIGRSDWDGSDDFLDAVDEVWTSLMRDVRLGAAHVFVPQEWLQAMGGRPGQQTQLDMDTEVFTALNVADAAEQKLEPYQADLRITDHIAAALALTERIVSAGGYSPQTFGLQIEGSAQSGTALRIREGKTDKLTSKKQRYFQPGIADTAKTLLDIGAEIFHTATTAEPVKVAWPELARDPAEQATWISTLRTAQAMSRENAVKAAQPDLDGDDLTEEVARVVAENTLADPFPMG